MRRRVVVGVGSAVAGVLAAGLVATAGSDSSLASHGYPTVTRTVTAPPTTRTVPPPPPGTKPVVIRASIRPRVRKSRFRVVCRISGGVGIERCRVTTSARVRGRRRTIGRGARVLLAGRANVTVRLNRVGRRALRKRLRVRVAVAPRPVQPGVAPLRKSATLVRRR